jgi:hypothetical protein
MKENGCIFKRYYNPMKEYIDNRVEINWLKKTRGYCLPRLYWLFNRNKELKYSFKCFGYRFDDKFTEL